MTEYGIQMYSLRDIAERDLGAALRRASEMGYRYVEFAGFFGHEAAQVRAWLEEYGLRCCGTHTSLDALCPDRIAETAAYHRAIGCDMLTVPWADWSTEEKARDNLARLREAQKTLSEYGITLGYHNHTGEFLKTSYGLFPEEALLSLAEVSPEPDIFWIFNAGVDPVAFLDAHRDRIRMIHLKDGIPCTPVQRLSGEAESGAVGTALGEGQAPVTLVRDWALRHGVLMVVESEGLDPTGPEEVGRCMKYLRSLEAEG